ncbi:TPA: hypothetical protein ACKP1B_002318 [Serratia fonticola]
MSVFAFRTGLIAGLVLLAGCQASPSPVEQPVPAASMANSDPVLPKIETPPPATPVREKIGMCQRELASLKQVNPKAYATRSANFDRLVNSAGVYTAVRGDISPQTKDTLDALYKFKTNRMCAEIERDVLQALIQRGENIK